MPEKQKKNLGGGVKVRSPSNPDRFFFVRKEQFDYGYYEEWTDEDDNRVAAKQKSAVEVVPPPKPSPPPAKPAEKAKPKDTPASDGASG